MAYTAHHRGAIYNVSLAGALHRTARLSFWCLGKLQISEEMRAHGPKSRIQNLNHLLQSYCFTVSDICIMNLSHSLCLHSPSCIPSPLYSESPSYFHVFLCVTHWIWVEFLAWAWVGGYLPEQGNFPVDPPEEKMTCPPPAAMNC